MTQTVEQVLTQMNICADMLGTPNEGKRTIYGFIPGLSDLEGQKELLDIISKIKDGIFQVVFTGPFSSGRSTLINALIRRDILSPMIPIFLDITKIIPTTLEEKAVIVYRERDENGRPLTVTMDFEKFFSFDPFDPKNKGKFKSIIDHVAFYLKESGIVDNLIQIIEFPSGSDHEVSYIRKANAIVFLFSAIQSFVKRDKEYIAEHFAGKHLKNVFFAVNKINLFTSDKDVDDLKKYVKDQLHDVFVDENGVFDEDLYNRRVFYIDAFGSMNTRLGRETPITRQIKVMVPDDETGVPEFEASLQDFLFQPDRVRSAMKPCLDTIIGLYHHAKNTSDTRMNLLREKKKKDWSRILTLMEESIESEAAKRLLSFAKSELSNLDVAYEEELVRVTRSLQAMASAISRIGDLLEESPALA